MQIFFNHGGHGMSFFNRLEDGISVAADIKPLVRRRCPGGDIRGFYSSTFHSAIFFSLLEKLTPILKILRLSFLKRPA